jgi:hypothetical protein
MTKNKKRGYQRGGTHEMTAGNVAIDRKFFLEKDLQFIALLSCIVCFARTYAGEKVVKEQRDSWQRRRQNRSGDCWCLKRQTVFPLLLRQGLQ